MLREGSRDELGGELVCQLGPHRICHIDALRVEWTLNLKNKTVVVSRKALPCL